MLIICWYTLSIIDNALGINSSREGRGTKQFKNLATEIKGKFQQLPLSPKGTICELSWTGCLVVCQRKMIGEGGATRFCEVGRKVYDR